MKQLSVLDLFSGGGGLHLTSEAAGGFQTMAFSEFGKYPSRVLTARFPDIPNLGDITKVEEFPRADIICGGFPCQDISVANPSGQGLKGARSGLWYHQLRAIQQVQPLGVLIENSNQLVKKGLSDVLEGLAAAGYDAEWYTVAASSIGAPHRRLRCCVIAYRRGARGAGLGAPFHLVKDGQWNWSGQADLREIYVRPYVPGPRWPQPLLRRVDDGLADRAHRLHIVGNGVVVPLFKQFFQLLRLRLEERGLV